MKSLKIVNFTSIHKSCGMAPTNTSIHPVNDPPLTFTGPAVVIPQQTTDIQHKIQHKRHGLWCRTKAFFGCKPKTKNTTNNQLISNSKPEPKPKPTDKLSEPLEPIEHDFTQNNKNKNIGKTKSFFTKVKNCFTSKDRIRRKHFEKVDQKRRLRRMFSEDKLAIETYEPKIKQKSMTFEVKAQIEPIPHWVMNRFLNDLDLCNPFNRLEPIRTDISSQQTIEQSVSKFSRQSEPESESDEQNMNLFEGFLQLTKEVIGDYYEPYMRPNRPEITGSVSTGSQSGRQPYIPTNSLVDEYRNQSIGRWIWKSFGLITLLLIISIFASDWVP